MFKLYLPTVTDAAIQTTRIITYLDGCGYPIVKIIPTVYAGYSMERAMTDNEIKAAIHCVAIIHFEALGLDVKMYNKGYASWLADREV